MEILTPKLRFRLNRLRRRWETWKASLRNTSQGVFTEQKMCPACRALVERHERRCPFCGEPLRVLGTGPLARAAARVVPADVPVTSLLIGVNLLIFTLECALNHGVPPIGFPLKGQIHENILLRLGQSLPMPINIGVVIKDQYWRWITSLFIHESIIHIGFNMWVLSDVGPLIEQLYGRAKYLLFYIIAGIAGNIVASDLWHQAVVGASGAIMGLIGVLIAYGIKNKTTVAQTMRSQAIRFAIYTLAFGMLPGISNAAHLGGIAVGFLLALLVTDEPPLTEGQIRFWRGVQWLMIGVTAFSFLLMARTPLP